MSCAPVHKPFMANLRELARTHNAAIRTIGMRYRNPKNPQETEELKDMEWYDPEVQGLLHHAVDLNDNLVVLGNLSVQATRRNPLTGFQTLTGHKSCILGHGQLALETVATPLHDMPKIMATTGACTVAQYNDSTAGILAEHHHVLGATLVEVVDNTVFHMRQIVAHSNGSFTDLTHQYVNGRRVDAPRAEALVLGDLHMETIDEAAWRASVVGPQSMLETLRPRTVVGHDILDFSYRGHHDLKDFFRQYGHWTNKWTNVRTHLDSVCDRMVWLAGRPALDRFVVVPSNHHDHLDIWLKSTTPQQDPENARLWCDLMSAKLRDIEAGAGRSAFQIYFEDIHTHDRRTGRKLLWLQTDQGWDIEGVNAGDHGHLGPNGSRGGKAGLARLGTKHFFGHTHSPAIKWGAWWVGVLGSLKPGYVKGPSSWLHTNGVVYKGGKRTLLNIIDGKWRRKYIVKP